MEIPFVVVAAFSLVALFGCSITLVHGLRILLRRGADWHLGTPQAVIDERRRHARLEVVFSLLGVALLLGSTLRDTPRAPGLDRPQVVIDHHDTGVLRSRTRAFLIDAGFAGGETCDERSLNGRELDAAVTYIEAERAQGMEVFMFVLGGHDVRPLKLRLRLKYESNLVLAQRRADCIATVLRKRKGLPADAVIALPVGAHHESATEPSVPNGTTKTSRDANLATDRRVELRVLSWGHRKTD
jgi:hypothetical protein